MTRARPAGRWRLLRRLVGVLLLLSLPAAAASLVLPGVAHARGDRLVVVLSGSMSPTFETGDAILVRSVTPEQLATGMVVTFRAGGSGATTTHRITALRTIDGRDYVQTKGDANRAPDPDLTPVEGVVAALDATWPGAGRWIVWSQSRSGRLLLLGPALVLLALSQVLAHLATPDRPAARVSRPAGGPAAGRRRLLPRRPQDGRAGRRPRALRPRGARPAASCALVGLLCTAGLAGSASDGTHTTLSALALVAGNAVATGTLNPPTALTAAAAGAAVNLSWTATTSTSATGYLVLRGTASGGPYTQIATVSGATTTSYVDSTAGMGAAFYVLRSVLQNWTSVPSNEASATVANQMVTTALTSCTSQAADTGGNGNGYEVTPLNGCTKDTVMAQDQKSGSTKIVSCTDPGKDRHRFWTYNLAVPSTATTINGLQVQIDANPSTGNGTGIICAQLSGDGGATWTTAKMTVNMTTTASATYLLGSTTDLWGTTWTPSQLSNANFRIRLIDVDDTGNKGFSLDYVGIRVTYTS